MSALTRFFKLIKPGKPDGYKVKDFNDNFDIIDTEMHRPPLSVNGVFPDPETRDLPIEEVPLAQNLATDIAQLIVGAFKERTTGGNSSIDTGNATVQAFKGNCVHTGVVEESIDMTVNSESITATLDRATFVAYVDESGEITLSYTDAWSANPALYGITVSGTPTDGDSIVIEYAKASRGIITPASPVTFNSTGWNLFDKTVHYARVVRYSEDHGYRIGGNYTTIKFALTPTGTGETVEVVDGLFNVPEDGYILLTGDDSTTYIYPTHTDWIEGYVGNFQGYLVDTIDLAEIMVAFENGLCSVGVVRDEINYNTHTCIQRIGRLDYTAENLATVVESGAAYDADENYIYYVLDEPEEVAEISPSETGAYPVNDHGIEFFTGEGAPVYTEILYGENLKDKLRSDVVTISAQDLTAGQQAQVLQNIGAASAAALALVGSITAKLEDSTVYLATSTNTHLSSVVLNKGVYIVQAAASFGANSTGLRQLYFSLTRAGSLLNRFSVFQNSPTSTGSATRMALTSIVEIAADNTTLYLVGLQTSGSLLAVDGIGIQAVKIK